MLSQAQVARGFYAQSEDPQRAAGLALGRLERAGLVERREILAGPELALAAPLWTWRPGDAPPPHREISRLARGRWTHTPRLERVVIATAKGRRLLGANIRKAGLVKPLQARHDLNLAGVFTVYRSSNLELANHWVGEDSFEPGLVPAGHVPDAVLLSPQGGVERAVEFVGAYPPSRVSAFCTFAMRARLPFELW
ncbi:MAG TPA: hypothetical protein VK550_16185 [Polyangiaceae bacterium]|nr:hypothetical protein [Polyangiaceae bacterium]